MKVVVSSGERFGCGSDTLVSCLYLTMREITDRNLVPTDFKGGQYGNLYLPSREDHLVIVSERLDSMILVGVFSCQLQANDLMGWYYRNGNDVDEFNVEEWFEWNEGLGCPTGCHDLKLALVEAVIEHRRRGGLC